MHAGCQLPARVPRGRRRVDKLRARRARPCRVAGSRQQLRRLEPVPPGRAGVPNAAPRAVAFPGAPGERTGGLAPCRWARCTQPAVPRTVTHWTSRGRSDLRHTRHCGALFHGRGLTAERGNQGPDDDARHRRSAADERLKADPLSRLPDAPLARKTGGLLHGFGEHAAMDCTLGDVLYTGTEPRVVTGDLQWPDAPSARPARNPGGGPEEACLTPRPSAARSTRRQRCTGVAERRPLTARAARTTRRHRRSRRGTSP
jgi:hypothetical protein